MIFQQPCIMKSWLLKQQQLWPFSLAGADYAPLLCHPLATCRMQPQAQLKDCAPQDSEGLKMITHDSGIRVIFTNEQKLAQIRNAVATDGQFRNVNATAVAVQKM